MSMKDFLIKKALATELKDLPQEDRDKLLKIVQNNQDLLQKVASEIEENVKAGQDRVSTTMEVMQKHKDELKF